MFHNLISGARCVFGFRLLLMDFCLGVGVGDLYFLTFGLAIALFSENDFELFLE